MNVKIGTRGSQLALWQANYIKSQLSQHCPEHNFELVIIKTEGDADQKSSLTQIGGQGVFTKAIEQALLENKIDLAVHSLKDLPSSMPDGLTLGAVPPRAAVEDVLVTQNGRSLSQLKQNSVIATGSLRRRSQLLFLRPDLTLNDLRGNIDTRLRKLQEQNLDGIIMAKAAILRLGLNDVKYYTFPANEMIPGVAQGAIGVQIRANEEEIAQIVNTVNDSKTYSEVVTERAFLNELDSGCQFPIGGFAQLTQDSISIEGFVGTPDGKTVIKESVTGYGSATDETGRNLAKKFIEKGALDILKQSNDPDV